MRTRMNLFHQMMFVLFMLIVAGMTGCKKSDSGTNAPPPGGSNPSSNTVTMQNTAFSPGTLTVAAGTTVTWNNNDNMTHTVTSGAPGAPDGKFDSGNMAPDKTFQFTFATKGTYPYYCVIHAASMKATVVVQ